MNSSPVLNEMPTPLLARPSILQPWNVPVEGITRVVRPPDCLPEEPANLFDNVVFDNVLCLSSNPSRELREARRVLKPRGRLIIGDVVRKRTLPSDLEGQSALRACGFIQAILLTDYPRLLREAGFADFEMAELPDVERLIAEHDRTLPAESPTTRPVTEEEWIASTQACCGLGGPRSERLAEILRCDDVNSLWTTVVIVARRL